MKNVNKTLKVLALALLAVVFVTSCNDNIQPTEKTDKGNAAIDNIMTRTSIRSFTDRAV